MKTQLAAGLATGLRTMLMSAMLLLAACGGGGGSSDDGSDPDDTSPPPTTEPPVTEPPPAPADPNAISLSLHSGDYLEYYAYAYDAQYAQGSGGSAEEDAATFKLTLGDPVTVGGIRLYPISLSGRSKLLDQFDFAPRWRYLGAADGKLYGSQDGSTVETLYAPDGKFAGFFSERDASTAATLSSQNFDGDYTQGTALRYGTGNSSGGCQTIGGVTVCDEDSQNWSFGESFVDGVGPLGMSLSRQTSYSGGGFYSTYTTRYRVGLLRTSLNTGAITLKPGPHEAAPLPGSFAKPLATAHAGKLLVFGDAASASGANKRLQSYDPAANAWTDLGEVSASLPDYEVLTIGDTSYFVGAGPTYAYDHGSASWSTPATASPVLDLSAGLNLVTVSGQPRVARTWKLATWNTASEQRIVMVQGERYQVSNGSVARQQTSVLVNVYSPANRSWEPLGTFELSGLYRIDGIAVSGDRLTIAASGGPSYRPIVVDLAAGEYDADSLAVANGGRTFSATALATDDGLLCIGGSSRDGTTTATSIRDTARYDAGTDSWSEGVELLRGRSTASAVLLDDRAYVIGGATTPDRASSLVEFIDLGASDAQARSASLTAKSSAPAWKPLVRTQR